MIQGDDEVYAWIVRSKSPRESGMWVYGDRDHAHRFVEHKSNEDVSWDRRCRGVWMALDGDRHWSVKRFEIEDGVALAVSEPASVQQR